MRLTTLEKQALAEAIRDIHFPVYLFGSRVDDLKKGGDIDLLILTRGLSSKERFDLSIQVAARFRKICDEKVDVIIFDQDHLTSEQNAFLASITKVALTPKNL